VCTRAAETQFGSSILELVHAMRVTTVSFDNPPTLNEPERATSRKRERVHFVCFRLRQCGYGSGYVEFVCVHTPSEDEDALRPHCERVRFVCFRSMTVRVLHGTTGFRVRSRTYLPKPRTRSVRTVREYVSCAIRTLLRESEALCVDLNQATISPKAYETNKLWFYILLAELA
jgi:hypothetical protein